MSILTTVAIPVRNGARVLEQTLSAVRAQRLGSGAELELLVCDSGSRDGSVKLARRYGAEVIQIAPGAFGHGATRNLLLERSHGSHVAFLTQDAVPADAAWLSRLLAGFALAADIGLVFGSYRPAADASPMVARELTEWFRALSPAGRPRVDRLAPAQRSVPARELLGARGFFTDANGCVSRAAWEQVRFRDVAYAEDQFLAVDMLRGGLAKVYVPDAAVIHSHEYTTLGWLRRSFDEARALNEIYDWSEPLHFHTMALNLWGRVGADLRWARAAGAIQGPSGDLVSLLAHSALHHTARILGAVLGARSARIPPALVERLSLERRRR